MTAELLSSAGFLLVTPLAAAPGGLARFFATTGFIGPLMLLGAVLAAVIALRRWLELRPGSLAPLALQRELETHVRDGALVLDKAASSRSLLGALVTGGMILRRAGLDEMLAGVERAASKEALRLGNRISNLARVGGIVLLVGLFGTTIGLMSMLAVIGELAAPTVSDFAQGIGQALSCAALGLFVALFCFVAFFWLDSRLTQRLLAVREIAEDLMRDAAEGAPH